MLAELAAANAAFQVIKTAVKNGGEIISAGESLIEYFKNKSKLQEKIESKPEHRRSDLEEFIALEQLKAQEKELKELMIYYGRPGLWDDWCTFQVQARHQREEEHRKKLKEELAKKKEKETFLENLLLVFWITALSVTIIGLMTMIAINSIS